MLLAPVDVMLMVVMVLVLCDVDCWCCCKLYFPIPILYTPDTPCTQIPGWLDGIQSQGVLQGAAFTL
jgi:hypothetical protein